MKTLLVTLMLAGTLTASAQLLEAPPPAPDLHLVGHHIEKAGNQRNTAVLDALLSGAMGAAMLSMDEENLNMAGGIMGGGFAIGLGLNISANFHERKAGKLLKGVH